MSSGIRFGVADLAVSALFVAIAGAMSAAAWSLGGIGGVFPRLVASAALVLALADFGLRVVRLARADGGDAGEEPARGREILALAWPVLFVGLAYLFGFYLALPLFMGIFFLHRRTIGPVAGLLVMVLFSAAMYGVFSVLLGVRIFPGVLAGLF